MPAAAAAAAAEPLRCLDIRWWATSRWLPMERSEDDDGDDDEGTELLPAAVMEKESATEICKRLHIHAKTKYLFDILCVVGWIPSANR